MNQLIQRIEKHIQVLSEFTSTPGNGVTRVLYSDEDVQAKTYLKNEMKKLSLEITEDEIGNIFATWKGTKEGQAQVWTGSHTDAPTNGGKYDGVVGVISALEAIRLLKEKDYQPINDIVVVVFVAEEPTKFGVGCIGSRAMAGLITDNDLDAWVDPNNQTFNDVLLSLDKSPKKVINDLMNPSQIKSFVEVHIEQGPVLEEVEKPIGIVNIISAPTEVALTIYGEQRHAGSTPMNIRKDPVPAASEVILLVEKLASTMSETSVGTIGSVVVSPGTSNVIADHVELSIDIRDIDNDKKHNIMKELKDNIDNIMVKRDLKYTWNIKSDDQPALMDESNVEIIKACAEKLNLPYQVMYSGAYHDALVMSKKVPSNLIFIPSNKGISHSPDEFTSTYHITKGIEVLTMFLEKITNKDEV